MKRQLGRFGRRGRARDRQPIAAGDDRDAELPFDPIQMLVAFAIKRRQQQIVVEFELGAAFSRLGCDDAAEGGAVMRQPSRRDCFDRRRDIRAGTTSPIRSSAAARWTLCR